MSHYQPVAWMVYTQDGQSCYVTDNPADISPNQRALPLYTEPPSPDEVIHPAITHCDNCGCDWLDNGLNPVGCPYCKQSSEVEALRAERDALLDALRQIAEWPDGGNRYGQEKIKRFAQHTIDAAIDAAMEKEARND